MQTNECLNVPMRREVLYKGYVTETSKTNSQI